MIMTRMANPSRSLVQAVKASGIGLIRLRFLDGRWPGREQLCNLAWNVVPPTAAPSRRWCCAGWSGLAKIMTRKANPSRSLVQAAKAIGIGLIRLRFLDGRWTGREQPWNVVHPIVGWSGLAKIKTKTGLAEMGILHNHSLPRMSLAWTANSYL